MKKRHFFGILAASALVAGLTSYTIARSSSPSETVEARTEFASNGAGIHFTNYQRDNYPDLTYAAENAVKAVVNIQKTEEVKVRTQAASPFFEFFGIPLDENYGGGSTFRERQSGGSGVIISPDGYIVTNNHVVENASKLKVTLADDKIYDAEIIGTDPTTDIALIKIQGTDFPTLGFGNSDELRLGEWVLAIGSPYDLQSTVTAGIVSAKARNLNIIPNEFRIESFIQTDAAVNPGNSGGPLVNVNGEIVGINTVIKSPTGSFTGYSFAVPSGVVQKVVVDLKEYGVVQRAMLGVLYSEINSDFIEREGKDKGITETGGLYVHEVTPGGAAEAAGIRSGDIIVSVDGRPTDHTSAMMEIIAKYRPNDKVNVTVKRNGELKQFEAVLRNKAGKAELLAKDYIDAAEILGGSFGTITEKAAKELKVDGGIQVTAIKEGGLLSKARIRKGYVITHINDIPVRSVSELNKINGKITSIDGVYPDGRGVSYSFIE